MSHLPIRLTDHAIVRYRDRVKPTLGRKDAAADLERMLPYGKIATERPSFANPSDIPRPPELWLLIGDGIALPLVRQGGTYFAITCLTNGGLSERVRRAVNAHKKRARGRRRQLSSKRFSKKEGKRRKNGVTK